MDTTSHDKTGTETTCHQAVTVVLRQNQKACAQLNFQKEKQVLPDDVASR